MVLIAGGLTVTACGSQHTATMPSSAAHTTAAARPSVTATHAAATPTAVHGNITLSAQGRFLPPGPFAITPLYCGRFTAAQRDQYGTNATAGLIYRYTNMSNTLTGAAVVQANFTDGSTVAGNNVAGDLSPTDPGQSATGEVEAVGNGGQNLTFTGCTLMEYAVNTSSGTLPTSYAP